VQIQKLAGLAVATAILVGSSLQAQTTQTVALAFGTPVSGPDSVFTVNLLLNPGAVDISGFSVIVAYDNTQVELESVSDNTGQPTAAVEYTMGAEYPFSSEPGANVYVPVIMDTAFSLQSPVNIAQLNFRSTTGFSSGVYVYLDNHLDEGLVDAEFQPIPTEYGSLQPATSVENWTIY